MNYKIYKFVFNGAVHFGKNSLESSDYTFCADTLFSALCMEAIKVGEEELDKLYKYVITERLLISDAFPFMNDTFFLPKPMTHIENSVDNGDSSIKKAYKKIQFIPADDIDAYFMGEYDVRTAPDLDNNLGSFDMKVLASIRGEEETKPYRISTYYFEEGNGLYIIVGYEGDDTLSFIDNLLHNLSFSGIGGKRMAGMGKFKLYPESVPNDIQNRLETKGKRYMTLSVSLPREEEMERVLKDAEYILCKRSGFVSSDKYAKNYMRKKDLYVLKTGACVSEKYKGDIYDVSGKMGEHPVYRYAKPMFLKV